MNTLKWHSVVFTTIFVLMAAGLITLLISRSTHAKIKAIPYALAYGLGVVVWLAALFYAQFVANTFLTHRLSFSAAYLVTLGMLGLALTFPNNPPGKRAKVLLALDVFIGSAFVGLIVFTSSVLSAANFAARPAPIVPLGEAYLLMIGINLVCAVAIFVRRYMTEVRNRLYFNYVVLAFIMLFLTGVTTNLILPLAGLVSFALVGPLAALLPFVAVVYALGITDINDVNYVITQLIQVGARFVVMVGFFVAGLWLHHALGVGYYSSTWIIAMGILSTIGVIGFYLCGGTFDYFIENKVAYSRLSPDEARTKLIVGLSGEIGLDRNASLVLRLLKQAIGVRAIGIVLFAKDGTFVELGELTLTRSDTRSTLEAMAGLPKRKNKAAGLINANTLVGEVRQMLEAQGIFAVKPLRTEAGIGGLYLLGEKFSQEIFTKQDATLMHAITEISDLSIERALFYDQIQSFNATLQQRVDDATQRLKKANRRLRALDILKDDFISMASHQLRSPATSVRDAIKMLEQHYLTSAERQKIIQLADASSERLVSVITGMLSVARIQAGHFTLEKSEVEMGQLVERALLQASALAAEKHITLQFDRPKQAIILTADRPKLNEIMANYIENAIRYSSEHTSVTITLKKANDRVHFTVSDHGIGVPESDRKDLFAKFFRASNARQAQPNGNGIGLFVVKTVALEHDGDAYYEPLEHGSLFGFWLPARNS